MQIFSGTYLPKYFLGNQIYTSAQRVTLTFYAKKCRILQTEYSWSYGTEGS